MFYDLSMLFVVIGNDVPKRSQYTEKLLSTLKKKRQDAEFFEIDEFSFSEEQLKELLASQGLFERKTIVYLKDLLSEKEIRKIIAGYAPQLQSSENAFVLTGDSLDAPTKKKFEKNSFELVDFSEKGKKTQEFNVFSLSEAVASRDSLRAWLLLHEALRAGLEPENIQGVLFWQIKSLLLAKSSSSAEEAGLKPFVYSKSKKHAERFSEEELDQLFETTLRAYHLAHEGEVTLEEELERICLSL